MRNILPRQIAQALKDTFFKHADDDTYQLLGNNGGPFPEAVLDAYGNAVGLATPTGTNPLVISGAGNAVIVGDSYGTTQLVANVNGNIFTAQGLFPMVNAMLGSPWNIVANLSFSGYRTDQWYPLMTGTLATIYTPRWILLFAGYINDVAAGVSAATIIANLTKFYGFCASIGCQVIHVNAIPVSAAGYTDTAAKLAVFHAVNEWVMRTAPYSGAFPHVTPIDGYSPYVDVTTGAAFTNYNDAAGLHPAELGVSAMLPSVYTALYRLGLPVKANFGGYADYGNLMNTAAFAVGTTGGPSSGLGGQPSVKYSGNGTNGIGTGLLTTASIAAGVGANAGYGVLTVTTFGVQTVPFALGCMLTGGGTSTSNIVLSLLTGTLGANGSTYLTYVSEVTTPTGYSGATTGGWNATNNSSGAGISGNWSLIQRTDSIQGWWSRMTAPAAQASNIGLSRALKNSGAANTAWAANTAKSTGAQSFVVPTAGNNGFIYICSTSGTTHATTEPIWPTTTGATITDGTVVWTAQPLPSPGDVIQLRAEVRFPTSTQLGQYVIQIVSGGTTYTAAWALNNTAAATPWKLPNPSLSNGILTVETPPMTVPVGVTALTVSCLVKPTATGTQMDMDVGRCQVRFISRAGSGFSL